ncbi:hypothetical protein LMH87_011549 [Akanthomyces muscarius]|uniref:Myb-like DNA-binding domain-containing protein n=1 Tax=Akanthomyces muscarius TaxID=2231603 RepID=A0A9W8UL37_AKAMU|nr:hypothetical protein LMH87_011549 [Akanthomyces muscarius]KAJ4150816.1 hypothetical protein LMH87_011549 [Akanthomyces muscarius]
MSNKTDPKENVRFLVACINHSTNGKPNFDLVAKELDIVSKGAAGKRYERLLKSAGVTNSGKCCGASPAALAAAAANDDDDEEPTKSTAKKRKAPDTAATPKAPALKKAKAAPHAKKTKVKAEAEEDDVADRDIKAEAESDSPLSDFPEELNENVKAEEA